MNKEFLRFLENEYNLSDVFIDYEENILFLTQKNKSRKFKLNQVITEEWIVSKIKIFLNLDNNNFKEIFKNLNLNGIVYPTTYGFGYNCLFSDEEKFKKDVELIKNILEKESIKYETEFSEARFVLRFKISKSNENINKIKIRI